MHFDIILENPLIYDGAGRIPYRNDIGIKDDKIAAVKNLKNAECNIRIKASDLSLCPGFIDVHSHADMAIHRPNHAKILEPFIRQGITTFVGGNCGAALAPISDKYSDTLFAFYDIFLGEDQKPHIQWKSFGEMLETIEKQGVLLNFAVLAPHGIIRINAKNNSTDLCSESELKEMKGILSECMEAGALGMSTGLMYFPGMFSDEHELLELAHVVHEYSGVFTSHLRSYNSDTIENAIDEVLNIGKNAEVPVQISHLFWVPYFPEPFRSMLKKFVNTASLIYNFWQFPNPFESSLKYHLDRIDKLIKQGYPIGIDAMPTSAGFTHLFAFFPPWSVQDGVEKLLERIANPLERKKIKESIENGEPVWPHRGKDNWSMNFFKVMGWDCAFVMSVVSEKNQKWVGKSFIEIGEKTGKHPFDAACDLAIEEKGRVLIFETPTYPGDPLIEASSQSNFLDPNVSIVTDAIMLGFGQPAHLFYDCYPKFLSEYARDKKLLSMAEAIRKCTSLPAKQLQIKNRGLIQEGNFADIVLFDEKTLKSKSLVKDPCHFPKGIKYVLINGKIVLDPDGFHSDLKAGKVIKRG
ncbi:MAG: amidohydrolase family protein [Desulfobacterales bacterium]|nr:amidohydrolase family protein [Desulfobacterales bacterium]MBF0396975.1 amidohydrolase family protein [Desulfobacterales bacterium]